MVLVACNGLNDEVLGVALMFTVHSKLEGLWLLSAQMGLIYGPRKNQAHYMGADLRTAVTSLCC